MNKFYSLFLFVALSLAPLLGASATTTQSTHSGLIQTSGKKLPFDLEIFRFALTYNAGDQRPINWNNFIGYGTLYNKRKVRHQIGRNSYSYAAGYGRSTAHVQTRCNNSTHRKSQVKH